MSNLEPKKLALLRIWQILQRESDFDHPLTQEDIADRLEKQYGIVVERKAIGRNLSLLREAGVEIESRRAGSYIAEREFEDAELHLLIDSVLASRHISARYSCDLIGKLCGLTSVYFRSSVRYIHSVDEWNKSDDPSLFYHIGLVDSAIERGRQIHYDYNKYGVDKKLHKSSHQFVSPYLMLLHNQRYYLMAYSEYWGNMVFHRMDRITNMEIVDKPATPLKDVPGYEHGPDYKQLTTALPYMYTDKPVRIDLEVDEGIVDQVVDWFGSEPVISKPTDGKVRVYLQASPQAMTHWVMQYGPRVKVVSPASLADKIKQELQEALEQY